VTGNDTASVGRRFRVVETLGRGGFGVVYRAESTSHGGFTKQVALKVLRKDVDLAGGVAERLRDEARILGLLNHRSIVKVDGLVELENGWAVVMEYVPGVNISRLVKHGCPPRAATEIVGAVASALHAAWHDVNDLTGEPLHLVHRDIKPANIRITPSGDVKVLDFGVARAEFADREAETVSVLFGSMRYMAPERLDGIEGPASDVYALAIVFAELLTGERFGEPPKHAGRHEEWVAKVVDAVQKALEDADEATTQAATALLQRALDYEPDPRPTAAELRGGCRELSRTLPGVSLQEYAEAVVPGLSARAAAARARKQTDDDAVDSVLVEHGSQSMHRAEVTGITRSRALVGGVVAGLGVAGIGAIVAGAAVLALALFLVLRPTDAPVATAPPAEPVAQPDPTPRPPKLVEVPRPVEPDTPAEPEPTPEPEPQPVVRPVRPSPPPKPSVSKGATVTLTGDLAQVRLVGDATHRLDAGDNKVSPGSYAVEASFDDRAPYEVSRIRVPEGTTVLHCSQMLFTCRVQ